jgi:hypothetical protein
VSDPGVPGTSTPTAPAAWQAQAVVEAPAYGDLAIMVDTAGVPHIAYGVSVGGGSTFAHAWREAGEFVSEPISQVDRGFNRAWVANAPEPRVVYDFHLYSALAAHAVRGVDGAWTEEILQLPGQSGALSGTWYEGRLLLAGLNQIRGVEYPGYESSSVLRYGLVVDGQMAPLESTRLALDMVPPQLAIGVDGAGTAHIVYSEPGDELAPGPLVDSSTPADVPKTSEWPPARIRYVTFRDGMWGEPETLAEPSSLYSGLSLAIDGSDNVHVTFANVSLWGVSASGQEPTFGIYHLERAPGGTAWQRELVPGTEPDRVARGSLVVGAAADVHLVYCRAGARSTIDGHVRCNSVNHAQKRAGTWSTETIETGCELGRDAALAVGGDGRLHAAYRGCEGELRYATRAAP